MSRHTTETLAELDALIREAQALREKVAAGALFPPSVPAGLVRRAEAVRYFALRAHAWRVQYQFLTEPVAPVMVFDPVPAPTPQTVVWCEKLPKHLQPVGSAS